MALTVIGVYDNYSEAQSAINELLANGFVREYVKMNPTENSPEARQKLLSSWHPSGTPESDTGIGHFFRHLFNMEEKSEDSDVYSEALRRGSFLVSVEADSEAQRDKATDILNRYHPIDMDERSSQWKREGWSGYQVSSAAFRDTDIATERSRDTKTSVENKLSIPVIQEELAVGKRAVQRGGVRVYQRVVETPVEQTVNLREEHVKVERHPVDQPATEADMAAFKEGSFELRESAEEAVVAKTARVVEEVVVNLETSEHKETITDTVRHSNVEVENLSASSAPGDDEFRRHWQTAYGASGGRYEDYAPAYRYGAESAGSARFKGHKWTDAEADIRRDWESRHPGTTWEKIKGSVKYGWERIMK